jgi:hypothetical protein
LSISGNLSQLSKSNNLKKTTQHAVAGDGSTGGVIFRRQFRFPCKTAE